MATEAQRAPRVAREQTSMADAAVLQRQAAHRAALNGLFKFSINDTTPFGGGATDLAHAALGKAHALSIALSIAISEGDETLRDVHAALCVDAIGDLVALAAFAVEGIEA